ncbi:MAG TPA: hypothetical protein VKT33_03745 [Candidatus Angelobacter sp.]|nr:hypothetical protein [Candidatus Angelobacter sp.]
MRGLIALIVALNFQMPSPAGKTKQPVITNSYSRENGDARQQKQKRKLPTPTAATSPNNAKEKRSNADDHQAEPAHGVYMVNMATPERPPQDTPLFVWYLIATVVGVAVNAVILYFIWKQTNINGKQARISLIAANAAKSSADTARNSLEIYKKQMRPWLIETLSAPGNDVPVKARNIIFAPTHAFTLTISNEVPNIAWIVEINARFHTINNLSLLPPEPDFGNKNREVFSGQGMIITHDSPLKRRIESDHGAAAFTAAIQNREIACAYGLVRYRGMFDSEIHETRFIYTSTNGYTWERSNEPQAYTK